MTHLSYQETYALELIHQLKDVRNSGSIEPLLLGLYACHFLDDLEARGMGVQDAGYVDEYLRQSGEEMFNKNLFYPALKKLMDLSLVEVESEIIFKHFSRVRLVRHAKENDVFLRNKFGTGLLRAARNDVSDAGGKKEAVVAPLPAKAVIASGAKQSSENKVSRRNAAFFKSHLLTEFILDILQSYKDIKNLPKLKSIIEVFNIQLLSFLHSFEKEKEKFEFRLFWPKSTSPEVYAMGDWFEEGKYKKNRETDEYLIENENAVIKLRGDQLHTKNRTDDFYGISRFTKKRKVDIPLDKKSVLQQKTVEVNKKRHLYKRKDHVKIEFATLTVQDEKWRTICIESPSLSTVLALSLLINPTHSEKLNYTRFLKKFYAPL